MNANMNMKWILSFTLLIMVSSVGAGLILAGLNPWESPARARAMDAETEYQRGANNEELRVKSAETDALIRNIEREQNVADWRAQADSTFAQQLNQEKLLAYRSFMQSISALIILLGIAVLATGSILIIKVFGTKYTPIKQDFAAAPNSKKQPSKTNDDRWANPEYINAMKQIARTNERNHRSQQLQSKDKVFPDTTRLWPDDEEDKTVNRLPWAE